MKEELVYLGVDIAKSYLDAAIGSEKRRFANERIGHRELIKWVKQLKVPVQVICESSGGYERGLIQALVGAQLKVSLVQANRYGSLRERTVFWPRPIGSTQRCCAFLEK